MEYALILHFDGETEYRIQTLIDRIADEAGCSYMREQGIPPHATLCLFQKETPVGLEEAAARLAQQISADKIVFASFGAFVPSVLFLAPVVSAYLLTSCALANKEMSEAGAALSGQYLPDSWVPHVTLAAKLDAAALCRAFESAQRGFAAFSGKTARLALARCNPYRELYAWALHGSSTTKGRTVD